MREHSGAAAWGARREFIAHVTAAMAQALHEPHSRARRLAIAHLEHLRHTERATRRVLTLLRAGQMPAFDARPAERKRIDAFLAYLTEEPAAKVVVAAHMAGFVLGVIKLLLQLPAGMHVQVPIPQRSAATLAVLTTVARHRSIALELVPIKGHALPSRAPSSSKISVIFTMIDLDATYGRCDTVAFLDAPAHLVIGPYVLARRQRASIVYLDNHDGELTFDAPCNDCVFEAPTSRALLRHFAARIEHSVYGDPCRWMRWHALPALRSSPQLRTPPAPPC